MLDCEIAPHCKFDRKNYFYPDMPKNYQISQYDLPICVGGAVPLHDLAYPKDAQKTIATPDKKVGLVRIHLEEDVAKSFHYETSTGIDFNRAGTPLMEIVTQPGDRLAGGGVRVPDQPAANPALRRRQRRRHGKRAAALRLQRVRAARGPAGVRREDRDQEHEQRQRRAQGAGLRDRPPGGRTRGRAARSNRKPAAGTIPAGRRSSCAPRKTRTTTAIFPIPT